MNKKVKNSARIVGEVIGKLTTDKVVIFTIKTETEINNKKIKSFPKVICFEKVRDQALDIQKGDFVLAECTIQANERNENIKHQSMKTIAVNHIKKVDPNDENFYQVNACRFFCRVIRTKQVSERTVVARIFFYTTKAHYMTVVFRSDDPSEVEDFCSITPKDPVILRGKIESSKHIRNNGEVFYRQDCVIRSFKNLARSNEPQTE